MTAFGDWLRAARKLHGMTLQEAADRAQITKSYLWELERGTRNPTIAVASRATRVFGVSLWRVLRQIEALD